MEFFKSKGGGQFFKRVGDRVVIVCKYGFNPSIEVTTYDPKLQVALACQDSDAAEFAQAYAEVLDKLASYFDSLVAAA